MTLYSTGINPRSIMSEQGFAVAAADPQVVELHGNDPARTTSDETQDDEKNALPSSAVVAAKVGVAPGDASPNPKKRKPAFYWFRKLLTISQLLDPIKIPNSFLNYQCMWWKAMSGNDKKSIVFDGGLNFDLLPPLTRWAVAPPLVSFYPRFHHANVELRTAYLDSTMEKLMSAWNDDPLRNNSHHSKQKIRLILLGGGYDLRSFRMAQKFTSKDSGSRIEELIELDLPQVIQAKQLLLQRRFLPRRPEFKGVASQIRTVGVDLNQVEQVRSTLDEIISSNPPENASNNKNDGTGSGDNWYTVFVFEAVLIYLDPGIPSQLLKALSEILQKNQSTGALCFADTLSNVDGGNEEMARDELQRNGWQLQDWCPKPGRTNHMGWATLL
jgi:hypothetical protein